MQDSVETGPLYGPVMRTLFEYRIVGLDTQSVLLFLWEIVCQEFYPLNKLVGGEV